MSVLNEVLLEEYKRIDKVVALIDKELELLPKGYVSVKNINGNKYFYLQQRKGKCIVSKYLGSEEPADLMRKIKKRKELEERKKSLLIDAKKLKGIVSEDK